MHLVKMFFTYGQKLKACTELRAILDAQATSNSSSHPPTPTPATETTRQTPN
jgi:hypothetical protein